MLTTHRTGKWRSDGLGTVDSRRVFPDAVRPYAGFIRRAETYLSIPHDVEFRLDRSIPDIASLPSASPPVVLIGKRWIASSDRASKEKKILHELLHIGVGLGHNDAARSIGYYSSPRRDRLSWVVYRDMQHHKTFDPGRVGLITVGDAIDW